MRHVQVKRMQRDARKQGGFTLLELMIAVTIGLAIIAALVGVLAADSGQSQSNDKTSELNTNGRFALSSMKQELRQAGYRGFTWAEPNVTASIGLPSSPTANMCFESGSSYEAFIGNLRQGVWGTTATNPFSANCIDSDDFADGNDVLVVRRVDGKPVAAPVANTVYFHSSYSMGQMFRGATAPSFGTVSPLADFETRVYVYYIRPYTTSINETPLVPSLRRMALDSTGKMVDELVASGIEHLRVQYGRLTTAPATRYLNASAITGGSADSPTTNTGYQWDEVNSVQIWLLARNASGEPGYVNNQTYLLGDTSITKADNYRRELFSTVVQLRN